MRAMVGAVLTASLVLTACTNDAADEPTTIPTTTTPTTTTTTVPTTTSTTTTTQATTTTTTEAATTTVVDPQVLIGTWLDSGAGVLVTFAEDGNHYVSYLNSEPFEFGPYTLEGNRLTMIGEDGPNPTCAGLGPGVFDIEIGADGSFVWGKVVSDDCAERRNGWAGGLTRYDGNE